jgi:hypothetical protein
MPQVTFAYGLTQMLNRKLEREMFRYVLSRAFLSHVISEAINFENELRGAQSFCASLKPPPHPPLLPSPPLAQRHD